MHPLRARMIEEMHLRNLSASTQRNYLWQLDAFERHFGQTADTLGPEAVRAWQLHLIDERRLSRSTLVTATAALRFIYVCVLRRPWANDGIAHSRAPLRLPIVLSPAEVGAFLDAIPSLKHRTILMCAYAAGLRISEALRLKVGDIDSQRMVLRVDQGKGLADRYVMLSPRLLEILRDYWQIARPRDWLFPGLRPGQPMRPETIRHACQRARERAGLRKAISPHAMRHAFATHLLEAGTDVRTIQLLLGHRSLATTSRYLRVSNAAVCATVSPFDQLPLTATPADPGPVSAHG